MEIFTKKAFYIRAFFQFLTFTFIFWLFDEGFKIFNGKPFLQTIYDFHFRYSLIIMAVIFAYLDIKRRERKTLSTGTK